MTSATGVALQVRSSACRKGRLENQGLKITLDYPAALKPARAAGDSVLKKNRKTQARSRTFLRSEQYNLPAMASRLSLSSPPLSGYFLSRKLCVCSGGATTLWFPPKSSLPIRIITNLCPIDPSLFSSEKWSTLWIIPSDSKDLSTFFPTAMRQSK